MENNESFKWYQKPTSIIIFLIFFFPIGLYLMWKNEIWSKTTRIVISIIFGLLLINSVNKNSKSNSNFPETTNIEDESINGTYSYSDNSAEIDLTVNGNMWSCRSVIKHGFGNEYDNENTDYQSGVIKGSDLYDSSGMVKIGYVNGKSLTTSFSGQEITLRKN